MATIIKIKRTTGATAPSGLNQGELAYVYDTGSSSTGAGGSGLRLYIGDPTSTSNSAIQIGGQYFTQLIDHALGTLTASSAILVDSNKAIDELLIGNNSTAGGAIKFNEGTNNGSNFIALKAPNSVGTSVTFTLPSSDGSDGHVLVTDGSGNLSFSAPASSAFTLAADSGSNDTFNTGETLTFAGDTGITTTVSNNQISIDLDDTSVSAGSYGSSTAIPTFTVDAQGRLTAAGTAAISTTLDIAADSGTDDGVVLGTDTLTFTGGTGIDTSVSGDTVTFAIDSTVVTLTGTQTLTNKTLTTPTLTTPRIADEGSINDANGNEYIKFQQTASAVNSLEVTNSATGNGAKLSTQGDDANIDLILDPKGSGVVDVNSSRISNLTDPTQDQDAATKSYVDNVVNGLDVKESVQVATTANLASTYNNGAGTLTASSNGALSIDGVTVSTNDRVLVKNQTDTKQNGIYVVTATGDGSNPFVLTRSGDADAASEITGGTFTFVEQGTANSENGFVFTHDGTPTLGTTAITVTQFSGAGQITAGAALTKTGNQLDVAVDDSTIEVSSDALQIKTTYPGQASITTLGTITTGVWNGTAIAATSGGTGLTSYSTGDIIRASGANTLAALSLGANGKILQSDGSNVTYGDIDGGTY
tara:strand:+ start:196 stop:2130 length:1935 start_codon:yes stop_codon:yes gene_type:complete